MGEGAVLKSGQKHKIRKIPLQFRRYVSSDLAKGTFRAKNKWIYIYALHKWGASIKHEIFVDSDGKYLQVNWGSGASNQWGKDERKATSPPRENVNITYNPDNFELYVFLSDVQLPYARLEDYRKNPDKIRRRAQLFEPNSEHTKSLNGQNGSTQGGNVLAFFLIDYPHIAERIQKDYLKELDAYYEYLDDKERRDKTFLATLTLQAVESYAKQDDDVYEWLWGGNTYSIEKYLDDENNKITHLCDKVEYPSLLKCQLIDSPGYQEMMDDYQGIEELEERLLVHCATVIDRTFESPKVRSSSGSGRTYLERWVRDPKSWLNRYVTGESFQLVRKSPPVYEAYGKLLEQWAVTKVKITSVRIFLPEYIRILEKRLSLKIKLKFLPGGLLQWVTEEEWQTIYVKRYRKYELSIIDVDRVKTKLPEIPASFLAALEVINLAMAGKQLRESKSGSEYVKNAIDLVGAIADLTGSLKDLLFKELKWAGFKIVGIIGSVLDYVGALWNAAEASAKGKYGLMTGYAIMAVGATFGAAGGALALGAEGAAAFGMGAVGWTGIGAVIVLLGVAIVWFFSDNENPFKDWVETCPWGRQPDKSKSIKGHTEALLEIIGKPKVKFVETVHLTPALPNDIAEFSGLKVVIMPGFFTGQSKYKLDVHFKVRSSYFPDDLELSHTNLIIPDKSSASVTSSSAEATRIVHRWSAEELWRVDTEGYNNIKHKFPRVKNLYLYHSEYSVACQFIEAGTRVGEPVKVSGTVGGHKTFLGHDTREWNNVEFE